MKRHSAFLFLAGAMLIPTVAQADVIAFGFRVDTSGIVSPSGGWIDFQFNQANAADSLSAIATIRLFSSTGFVFGSPALTSSGVTGDLFSLPVVIPNDQGAANYFTQPVTTWGSSFQFVVELSGLAVGTPAPDGSEFFVFLLDPGFNLLVSPLPSGEVLNVTIGTDGNAVRQDSELSSAIPEPGAVWLVLAGIALVGWKRRSQA